MAESVKRVRMQTAVLHTTIAENIRAMERDLSAVSWFDLSTNPRYIAIRSRLINQRRVLEMTDIHGTKNKKKEGTRLIKCKCSWCGYTVRTTMIWIMIGIVKCPNPDCDNKNQEMNVEIKDEEIAPTLDRFLLKEKPAVDENIDPFADLPGAGDLP